MAEMVVKRFLPPANLDDFRTEDQKMGWHEKVSGWFDKASEGTDPNQLFQTHSGDFYRIVGDGIRTQFFNPTKTQKLPDLTEKEISWIAFPEQVKVQDPSDRRFVIVDRSRSMQDEYCEFSVKRGSDGKIKRVEFTCEGPEYWEYLGETDPGKVLELYKQHVNENVEFTDLFTHSGGTWRYNRVNIWNRDVENGAMHLIHGPNSLQAEVELAGGSSMVRKPGDRILTGQDELIHCGAYGVATRNSDPTIGARVNELARTGFQISLKNPVGLYFGDFIPVGWQTKDGADPMEFYKITRGTTEAPVRVVFEVPAEKGYTVSDITIQGKPILFGSQIMDFIHVKLTGTAQGLDPARVTPFPCKKRINVRPPLVPFPSDPSSAVAAVATPQVAFEEEILEEDDPKRVAELFRGAVRTSQLHSRR